MTTAKTVTVAQATVRKLLAEEKAYLSESKYNELQGERLVRVRRSEDASLDRQRILDFVGEVEEQSVHHALRKLTEWRHTSKDPITIRFSTPGGEILPGMALYDYIRLLDSEGVEVTTIALGMAASMGSILLQAGTHRFVTGETWVMIHELASLAEGKLSEIIDQAKFYKRMDERMVGILANRSGTSVRAIRSRIRGGKEWWLTADETVKYGFADAVLGSSDRV